MEFDRERRKVLIASGSDKGIEYLTGQLSGGRYDTSYPVASAAEARRRLDSVAYDILIVNTPLKDEFGADFASGEAENSNIGVVLIVKNEIYDQIAYKTEDSGVIVLKAAVVVCADSGGKGSRRSPRKTCQGGEEDRDDAEANGRDPPCQPRKVGSNLKARHGRGKCPQIHRKTGDGSAADKVGGVAVHYPDL